MLSLERAGEGEAAGDEALLGEWGGSSGSCTDSEGMICLFPCWS